MQNDVATQEFFRQAVARMEARRAAWRPEDGAGVRSHRPARRSYHNPGAVGMVSAVDFDSGGLPAARPEIGHHHSALTRENFSYGVAPAVAPTGDFADPGPMEGWPLAVGAFVGVLLVCALGALVADNLAALLAGMW